MGNVAASGIPGAVFFAYEAAAASRAVPRIRKVVCATAVVSPDVFVMMCLPRQRAPVGECFCPDPAGSLA